METVFMEDHMEGWIHVRTTWKTGFLRGPHGRLDSYECHMEDWINVRTTWEDWIHVGPHGKTGFM